MSDPATAQILFTHGVALGSAFLGGIVANLASSFLWRGGMWVCKPLLDKIPDLAELLKRGGSQNNHDLLRALRRAECRAVVSLCDQTLRDDFSLPINSRKNLLVSWLRGRQEPEIRALCHIRHVFAQMYDDLQSLTVEDLVRLHGAAVFDVNALVKAGSECFAVDDPDELRHRVVSQYVAALDRVVRALPGQAGSSAFDLRTLAFDGLPSSLRLRMEQHPLGWWDSLRLAFREELKDPANERARLAWQLDVQSALPQQLGRTYDEFERKFSALDAKLTGAWDDLKNLRQALDDAVAEMTELLEGLGTTTHSIEKKVDEIQKDMQESKKQPASQRPFDLPKRALAGTLFGRVALRAELVERLRRREHVDIWGPAGMGKTALAAEAIRQVIGDTEDNLPTTPYPDGVVLLDLYALKCTSPEPAWMHLANAFDKSLPTTGARERAIAVCHGRRALVVVEGAEEAGDGTTLQQVLAVLAPQTTRLVLTRLKQQISTLKPLNVEAALARDEALALLRELCHEGKVDEAILVTIHERLGGHPLALTWAGHQLAAGEESPRAFVAALNQERLPELHEPGYETHTLGWLYRRSVEHLTPEARRVLAAVGLLARQSFPLSATLAVLTGDGHDGLATDESAARNALKQLVRHGMLRLSSGAEEQWEFTHALVHQFAQSNAEPTSLTALGLWAEQEFAHAVAQVRRNGDISILGHTLNHAGALLRADRDATRLDALRYSLLYDGLDQINALGRLDFATAASVAVHEWLHRALALRPDNTQWQRDLSVSHDKVGDVLVAQGQLAEALQAYSAGRTIAERLATHDPHNTQWQRDLSVSHNKVGNVLVKQQRRTEALAQFAKARAISTRLVQHDPSNAVWKSDLAWVESEIARLD